MTYMDVCDAKTETEMQQRFNILLQEAIYMVSKENPKLTLDEIKQMQLSNIGYFAGYYDDKKREQVKKWLGAIHPIFG